MNETGSIEVDAQVEVERTLAALDSSEPSCWRFDYGLGVTRGFAPPGLGSDVVQPRGQQCCCVKRFLLFQS